LAKEIRELASLQAGREAHVKSRQGSTRDLGTRFHESRSARRHFHGCTEHNRRAAITLTGLTPGLQIARPLVQATEIGSGRWIERMPDSHAPALKGNHGNPRAGYIGPTPQQILDAIPHAIAIGIVSQTIQGPDAKATDPSGESADRNKLSQGHTFDSTSRRSILRDQNRTPIDIRTVSMTREGLTTIVGTVRKMNRAMIPGSIVSSIGSQV
jgi:hypothetical protein